MACCQPGAYCERVAHLGSAPLEIKHERDGVILFDRYAHAAVAQPLSNPDATLGCNRTDDRAEST